MKAKFNDQLLSERRVGVQYFLDGRLIGLAFITLVVAYDEEAASSTAPPKSPTPGLLDMSVLLDAAAPDLVLTLTRSDDLIGQRFVWSGYSALDGFSVPDSAYREEQLTDAEIQQFTMNLRTAVSTNLLEDRLFADLAGRGKVVARRIARPIADAIKQLLQRPPRPGESSGTAPSLLLLSEELAVPWELADLGLASAAGGNSPFLGAHLAIGRWPLIRAEPRPKLLTSVIVTQSATVADGYENVASSGLGPGINQLPSAPVEATAFTEAYPPAQAVPATWSTVQELLSGRPAVDLIHMALHGNFDPAGNASGIIVVKAQDGKRVAETISPLQLSSGRLDSNPFVFVNACQLGAQSQTLGSDSGLATSLLSIGAAAVVASVWNVNDSVASAAALQFYEGVFIQNLTAGEALRRVRAKYTQTAAGHDKTITSTLIGYQLFGHPNLVLSR